jgi:hypothetical protein
MEATAQDFVSLHDKYESESEGRAAVRVVHVSCQEVQAGPAQVGEEDEDGKEDRLKKTRERSCPGAGAGADLVPRRRLSQQAQGQQGPPAAQVPCRHGRRYTCYFSMLFTFCC